MAFLVAQGTTEPLQAGPFVSALDGETVQDSLVITPAAIQLSVNGGPLHAMTGVANAVARSEGAYTFTLAPADTAAVGTTRVVIQMPQSLPVWLDMVVVQPATYATLAGAPAAPLLLTQTPVLLTMGPFVASLDGRTLQPGLSIPAASVFLSKQDGPFQPSTSLTAPVALGLGHYAVALSAADLDTLGTLRVSITLPGSLPVWLDVIVLSPTAWDFYFTPPPAMVIPPGPPTPSSPIPPGVRVAGSLFTSIAAGIDDP